MKVSVQTYQRGRRPERSMRPADVAHLNGLEQAHARLRGRLAEQELENDRLRAVGRETF